MVLHLDNGQAAPYTMTHGDLVEVEEQQAAVRAMVELKKQGTSLRAIAERMKA
jgi:hypothetical protein